MNHYINLLDPGECHYLPASESNPLYKLGAVAILVALMGWGYFSYQGLTSAIREGERVESWLAKNEEAVTETRERIRLGQRMEEARKTLAGWKSSRYDYPAIFAALAEAIPHPADRVQFTSLSFNESLIGLSQPRRSPGRGKTAHYPVERNVRIELKGVIGHERPDQVLERYRGRIEAAGDRLPFDAVSMRLDQGGRRRGSEEVVENITPFSAEFDLKPMEMSP